MLWQQGVLPPTNKVNPFPSHLFRIESWFFGTKAPVASTRGEFGGGSDTKLTCNTERLWSGV
jgi:hypothetical protein